MYNREYSKQHWFLYLCEEAKCEPTKRQASKYRMKKGTAYSFKFNL